jgi:hypothetical protein
MRGWLLLAAAAILLTAGVAFLYVRGRAAARAWIVRKGYRLGTLTFAAAFSRRFSVGCVNASLVFRVTLYDNFGTLCTGWLLLHDVLIGPPRVTPRWIKDERVRRGLSPVGSLDEEAAQRLEESARSIRATWR